MDEGLTFEIEQACKTLEAGGDGHLADAVGQMFREYRKLKQEHEKVKVSMDKLLLTIDKLYD